VNPEGCDATDFASCGLNTTGAPWPPKKGIENRSFTLEYITMQSARNFPRSSTRPNRAKPRRATASRSLPQKVLDLAAEYRPGWSLPGAFYFDEAVYHVDLASIWRRGWLFAGHSCEVPRPGDFFTFEMDTDSIVVIRGEGAKLHAFHNVCRHRGSLICTESAGHAKKLVCPYHQWTYGLDGELLACRGMPAEFDKSQFPLQPLNVREFEGLIYVSLAQSPCDPEPAARLMSPLARPQGFPGAKVARSVTYLVKANWKLIWENNRECYHCNVNHPQYIKANFDHYNADDTTPSIQSQMDAAVRRNKEDRGAGEFPAIRNHTGMTTFPDAQNNIWYSSNRTPLVEGYVTESMDGKRVAPLMGDNQEPGANTLRIRTLPNFWNHSSCDHGVSTRLMPLGPQITSVRVWWLVDAGAVEGRDYDLAKLMPFWQLTSEQDWEICERQQRGINSSAYRPGPYSLSKEYNVDGFIRWYLTSAGLGSTE
jgi:Rieske 2Fe-2S family protein